jgi:hypothetical protein
VLGVSSQLIAMDSLGKQPRLHGLGFAMVLSFGLFSDTSMLRCCCKLAGSRALSRPGPCLDPMHEQTAAKQRGSSPAALGFNAKKDSLLEGYGFEPVWGSSCQEAFWFIAGSLFGGVSR